MYSAFWSLPKPSMSCFPALKEQRVSFPLRPRQIHADFSSPQSGPEQTMDDCNSENLDLSCRLLDF